MPPTRRAHPGLFLILFLPLGITNGYVVVTLAYVLSHAGVGVEAIAALVAWSLFPQTWKVVWAPIVDATLTNKVWYLISALAVGGCMTATALVTPRPSNLAAIEILVVAINVALSFNAMAADSLMAYATPPDEKGRAGGWSQAGNLGGSGLGGGAGLWLAQHVHVVWLSGAALGLVCVASSAAVLFITEPAAEHRGRSLADSVANVARDVWSVVRARTGVLALFLMTLPIGAGAAQNLWAAVAGDWHASADTVALVNGVLGGVVSMAGCIVGGFVCDLMDRKAAYCLFGVVSAIVAVAMALSPRTELMFAIDVSIYAFVLGFCYAGFGAVVLEAIGTGAAATKYNLLASVSNMPIAYMTLVDGRAQHRWGSGGMLYTEALCGVAGVALFYAVAIGLARAWRDRRPRPGA